MTTPVTNICPNYCGVFQFGLGNNRLTHIVHTKPNTVGIVMWINQLEVATPTRRAFSGHGGHALSWRSHGHSLAAYL